jgi:hypothetical protein
MRFPSLSRTRILLIVYNAYEKKIFLEGGIESDAKPTIVTGYTTKLREHYFFSYELEEYEKKKSKSVLQRGHTTGARQLTSDGIESLLPF